MAKTNYEILKANERLREIYTLLLQEIETAPHLCFSKKKLRDCDYYDGINNDSRKTGGTIIIVDLPEDLGLKKLVVDQINATLKVLQAEFDSYTIQK